MTDTREKLEADILKFVAHWSYDDYVDDEVLEWNLDKCHKELSALLDRQAAITRDEVDNENADEILALNERRSELQAKVNELQHQLDNSMPLPLDADGVPIRVGEEMTSHGDVFMVCAVAPAKIHRWVTVKLGEPQTTYSYDPRECTHYKPRTVEDVLLDVIEYATCPSNSWDEIIAKYAQELRMVGE